MIPRGIVLALLSLNFATPAGASYLYWPNGSVTHLPDELIILAVLISAAAFFLSKMGNSPSSRVDRMSLDLPEEVREPESVEYYDDMTERTRALKSKLDADTELAETYINASRTRAELEEIEEIEAALGRRLSKDINARRGKAST
jgi:hypothetical protein